MNETIILASQSPRRIKLMKDYGYDPIVIPSGADEHLPPFMTPESSVMYLAFLKAWDVASSHASTYDTVSIIGADTVVVFDRKIIGKPKDPEDAFTTLSRLRNNCHHVITGVCITTKRGEIVTKDCFYEKTDVFFKDYSDEALWAYVNTDEPYDKAGGYAIQETFSRYIDHIEGDFDNVVGFPIRKIQAHLDPHR